MNFDFNILVPIANASAETASGGGSDIIGTLGLNWKLFIAQLINFGIVLGLLWKFVFGPVGEKLNERSEKIEKALKDADDIQLQKQEFEKWKDEQMALSRQEAGSIIQAAQESAETIRKESLLKLKKEQNKLIEQSKRQIDSDQEKSLAEIKSQVADLVTMATEKVLRQKLDDKHDLELIKKTVEELSHK